MADGGRHKIPTRPNRQSSLLLCLAVEAWSERGSSSWGGTRAGGEHTSSPRIRFFRRILMRTWKANLASVGQRFARTRLGIISATVAALLLLGGSALAQPATDEAGGEAALNLPD